MGIMFLDTKFNIKKYVILGKGNDVHQVRTARYGNNILFCSYKYFKKQGNSLQEWQFYELRPADFILLDPTGKIIEKSSFDIYFNPNDDFKTLSDGSVAWTHSD